MGRRPQKMILVKHDLSVSVFSTFPKSSVLHFPRFVLFWRFKKTRHGKMHEVRYRKFCLFNSVEDCFLYNCGYSSSFPLSRSVMLHFPTRFHQNQKRMLSFEDNCSFSTANSSHNVQASEIWNLASQIVYHHQVNLRHFFISIFFWTLENTVFEKTPNYRFA